MPPPTNIDFLSAADLGTLPASLTQQVDDSGSTYTVYYKYTAVPGENMIGFWGFGDLSTYRPFVNVYTGDPSAPTPWLPLNQITALNVPIQVYVVPGENYFFELVPNGNFTPSILTIDALTGPPPDASVPTGSIFISDDSDGFPAAILDNGTALPIRFVAPVVNGDFGDVLRSGIFLISDQLNGAVTLYDNQLAEVVSIPNPLYPGSTRSIVMRGNVTSQFYIADPGVGASHAKVGTISDTGAVGGTIWTLASAGILGLAPSPDETILYYTGAGSTVASPVLRWDLLADAPLTDLVAGIAGTTVGKDVLVLGDGTVLVSYRDQAPPNLWYVKRYDPTGALLNTYTFSDAKGNDFRMCNALDDPVSFETWSKIDSVGGGNGTSSRFDRIRVSDGAVTLSRGPVPQYEAGAYQPDQTATPLARFGHSNSCPLLIMQSPLAPPGCPGEVSGPRQDGLPYAPAPAEPCEGTGTVSGARIGT